MTETSRPWSGTTIGDAGPYSDAHWQELYQAIIGWGGNRANSGVFLMSGTEPADGLQVSESSPAAASVDVASGAALVQGIAYLNDGTETLAIAANGSGSARIDTVVLQADYALQTVRLVVLEGTPAGSPVAPSLTQSPDVLWEIPIADIAVASGFTTISDSNITPRADYVNMPPAVYLDHVLNNSAITLTDGMAVVWDTSADRAVTTTISRDHKKTAGVWRGNTAAGSYGRMQRLGIGYVKADAAVTRGDILLTGTTAGSATPNGTTQAAANAVLARALETTAGSGLALCNIDPHVTFDYDAVLVQDQKTTNTSGGTTVGVTGAWTTSTLNTEVVDTGSIATVGSNRVTLPAGRYEAWWTRPFGANVGASRTRLRDVTNNVTLAQAPNTLNPINSTGSAAFTLTGTADIEVQFWVTTGQANGLGAPVNSGDVEVYTSVYFRRNGETQ